MPLTLVIPDLSRLAAAAPRLPALETLLARAQRRPAPDVGLYGVLAQAFGLPGNGLPVAALTRLADSGARDAACWLRADPVHLVADRDQLVMLPLAALEVRAEEAQALTATFNAMYPDGDFRLEAPLPSRWYLRAPMNLDCMTHDPARIAGGAVFDYMPSGADAPRLKQLMNEMQMLFHEHPVNLAREAAGKPLINTAWLWGGGVLPEAAARCPRVMTNLPLVRGLALFSGSACVAWPSEPDALFADASALLAPSAEDVAALTEIELRAARPLLRGLRRGLLRALDIYPGGTMLYQVTRWQLRRFWRRRRPLTELVAGS